MKCVHPYQLRVSLFVVLLFLINSAFGQNSSGLKLKVDKAESFYKQGQYDSARHYADLALNSLGKTTKQSELYLRLKEIDIETDFANGNYDIVEEKVNQHLDFLKIHFPKDRDRLASIITIKAAWLKEFQSFLEADSHFLRAIQLRINEGDAPTLTADKARRNTTRLAKNYLWLANLKLNINQLDSAGFYYKKAIRLYESPGISDPLFLGQSHRGMAIFLYYKTEMDSAIASCHRALKAFDKSDKTHLDRIAATYTLLGNFHKQSNDLDSALIYSKNGLSINKEIKDPRDPTLAQAMQNTAIIYTAKGDFLRSERLLEEALEIVLSSSKKNDVFLMYLYNSLATVSFAKYHAPETGLDYQNEALKLIAASDRNFRIKAVEVSILLTAADGYLSRAQYNMRSNNIELASADFQRATKNREKALQIDLEITKGNSPVSISHYAKLAHAHFLSKKIDLAEKTYEDALRYAKRFVGDPVANTSLIEVYLGMSDLYNEKGDMGKFEKYWKLALDLIQKTPQNNPSTSIQAYNQIGASYRRLGDFEQARFFIKKAIDANITVSRDSLSSEKIKEQAYSFFLYIESVFQMSKIYEEDYLANDDIDKLKEASAYYQEYVDYVQVTLGSIRNQNDIIDLIGFSNNGFQGLARTSHKLFQKLGQPEHKETAFRASQLSRALVLKNSVSRKENRSFGQVPDSLLAQDYSADANIEYHLSRLQSARLRGDNEATIGEIQSRVFRAKIKKQNIRKALSEKYPGYYDLRYGTNLISSEELQKELPETETLIEYLDVSDQILAFVFTKKSFDIVSLPKTHDFDSLAGSFSSTLRSLDDSAADHLLKTLYTTIIAPLEQYFIGDKLAFIPDGSLWNINFDLLKPASNRYLLQDFSISHAYSSSSSSLSTTGKSASKKRLLAYSFGNQNDLTISNTIMRDSSLKELPGSAKEIFNLSEFLPGDYFYKNGTTESSFKELASDYNVLHLAIHGQIDESSYDRSRLYFNTDGQDTINDGLLYPFELYNMELKADLAVLSACNSGGGRIARGEGIMSLGRAFQYAGVNSLLLSKWEVSDAVAPEIITSFYQNLDEGMSKDEALRNAKLTYLENADNITKSPYYWGSFFVLGDPKPIALQSGFDYVKVAIIIFLFIFSSMIAFRLRMRKKLNTKSE